MLLANYGTETTLDMTLQQLIELGNALDGRYCENRGLVSARNEMDRLRKRLMGVVGRWLRAMGYNESAEMIKAVACRAAGKKTFNAIPADRLRSLYGAFSKRLKDLDETEAMEAEARLLPNERTGMLN